MNIQKPETLQIDAIVNKRYQIVAVVGQGGAGTVYQVRDLGSSDVKILALKETADLSKGAREQFEREARWLSELNHPNIPKVKDFFEWNDHLYLLMEYIFGENLELKLLHNKSRPLPVFDTLQWIMPICDALEYMHSLLPQIVHRDVKPANIIVNPDNMAYLVDLGIAKEHNPHAPNPTATFVRKAGTEGYAPPEQYSSNGATGPWSDIYSLGATLYHILTGNLPTPAIDRAALDKIITIPSLINPQISTELEMVIMRAIEIRPSDRFQSMREFKDALNKIYTVELQRAAAVKRSSPLKTQSLKKCSRCGIMYTGNGTICPMCSAEVNVPDYSIAQTVRSGKPFTLPPSQSQPQASSSIPPSRNPSYPNLPASPAQPAQQQINPVFPPPGPIYRPETTAVSEPRKPIERKHRLLKNKPEEEKKPAKTRSFNRAKPDSNSAENKPRHGFLWQIAAGFVIVAMVVFALLYGAHIITFGSIDQSSPISAVNGFYASLQSQNYQQAYQYLSPNADLSDTQGQFSALEQSIQSQEGAIQSYTIQSQSNGDATLGQIQITIKVVRGKGVFISQLTLISQGSKWYIDQFPNN